VDFDAFDQCFREREELVLVRLKMDFLIKKTLYLVLQAWYDTECCSANQRIGSYMKYGNNQITPKEGI
jgi:hypothetical protein